MKGKVIPFPLRKQEQKNSLHEYISLGLVSLFLWPLTLSFGVPLFILALINWVHPGSKPGTKAGLIHGAIVIGLALASASLWYGLGLLRFG